MGWYQRRISGGYRLCELSGGSERFCDEPSLLAEPSEDPDSTLSSGLENRERVLRLPDWPITESLTTSREFANKVSSTDPACAPRVGRASHRSLFFFLRFPSTMKKKS